MKAEKGVADARDEEHHDRHRFGSAHAARPAAGCRVHPHQYRNSEPDRGAEDPDRSSARARWAWNSPPSSSASAPKSRILEMLPRMVPVEDEEVSKELERVFKKQKIRVETGAKCENIQKTGNGREARRHAGQRQAGRRGSREAAGRRGPQAEHREHRAREHEGRTRPRLHQGGSSTSRPASRASTPSAMSSPARRNWRMWRRCEGMVAVAHMAGKPVTPINRIASRARPTPSPASAASA